MSKISVSLWRRLSIVASKRNHCRSIENFPRRKVCGIACTVQFRSTHTELYPRRSIRESGFWLWVMKMQSVAYSCIFVTSRKKQWISFIFRMACLW
jgi:hypothetical protein